jgi:Response regulator containing CheY-like receiver and SARP domains
MKTIMVDNEVKAIKIFETYAKDMPDVELMGEFTDGMEAAVFVKEHPVDLAVLDVEMEGVDGISLGKMLKLLYPDILLIYITGHEDYAMDAFRLHAAAYLLKPYTRDQLYYEIETAKLLSRRVRKGIFVKTFGHFDVFVNGRPIMFRSGKAKELMAFLVDRQGGTVNTDQIICALWENRPNDEATQNLCSKVCKALGNELRENGAEKVLVSKRGVKRVDTERFSCDLYDLLADDEKAKKNFVGDYMLDYSWAEERMGLLSKYLAN